MKVQPGYNHVIGIFFVIALAFGVILIIAWEPSRWTFYRSSYLGGALRSTVTGAFRGTSTLPPITEFVASGFSLVGKR